MEDKDDVEFYTKIYNILVERKMLSADVPLVFIPASTKDNSGGKSVVEHWVNKLQSSGIEKIIGGLIDADSDNEASESVHLLARYSIENYLIDPMLVYLVLLEKECHFKVDGFSFGIGDQLAITRLPNDHLQLIADAVIAKMEPRLVEHFPDLTDDDKNTTEVKFINGAHLFYPKWLLQKKGKTLLRQVLGDVFTTPIVNFQTLSRAMRRTEFISSEFLDLFANLRK